MNKLVRRDKKRRELYYYYELERLFLKQCIQNNKLISSQRLKAQMLLSQFPRDASKVRIRNRCVVTGRGRGVYRQFKLSRIIIRSLANNGLLAGMTKVSW